MAVERREKGFVVSFTKAIIVMNILSNDTNEKVNT